MMMIKPVKISSQRILKLEYKRTQNGYCEAISAPLVDKQGQSV